MVSVASHGACYPDAVTCGLWPARLFCTAPVRSPRRRWAPLLLNLLEGGNPAGPSRVLRLTDLTFDMASLSALVGV